MSWAHTNMHEYDPFTPFNTNVLHFGAGVCFAVVVFYVFVVFKLRTFLGK